MEFHEILQALRKRSGLTQEELASALYVSRAAVSKWESGRGYPNIDSLKAIAAYFSVTVDDLLSGGEALTIAEEDHRQRAAHLRDLVWGALDCGMALLLFLPFFGQAADGVIRPVSLLALTGVQPYLKTAYVLWVAGMVLWGILTLALQTCRRPLWAQSKTCGSLLLSLAGTLLFTVSRQPYAAALVLVFLAVKVLMLLKRP